MKRVFLSCVTGLLLLSLCLSLAACGVKKTSEPTAEEALAASEAAQAEILAEAAPTPAPTPTPTPPPPPGPQPHAGSQTRY